MADEGGWDDLTLALKGVSGFVPTTPEHEEFEQVRKHYLRYVAARMDNSEWSWKASILSAIAKSDKTGQYFKEAYDAASGVTEVQIAKRKAELDKKWDEVHGDRNSEDMKARIDAAIKASREIRKPVEQKKPKKKGRRRGR